MSTETKQATKDAEKRLQTIIKLKADVELMAAKGIELYWIVDANYNIGQTQVDTADFYDFLKVQAEKATKAWAETL